MQDELKPVAWRYDHPDHMTEYGTLRLTDGDKASGWTETPLYAHPPTTNPVDDRETPVGDHQMVEAVAELQLAAFLAGRGSVTSMKHGTRTAKPCPTMDDFRGMAQSALTAARAQVDAENQRLREALDNAATLLAKAVGDIVAYQMITNKRPDESAADEYVEGINAIDALLAAGEHRKDAP